MQSKAMEKAQIAALEAEAAARAATSEAEAAKNRAEAAVRLAEAARHTEETKTAALQRQATEIGLAKAQRQEELELAQNAYHYAYPFITAIDANSVMHCISQLNTWMRTKPGCDIEIIFNSPGGDVVEGMALFDYIQQVRTAGHHVTTTALGMAASMAGILLQAGDKRVMGKEAWVLIHEASFGARGKIGEVEDTVKWVKMVQGRILKIFAARSKLSERAIAARWKRTDWWLSSDECLKYGLVDEVR